MQRDIYAGLRHISRRRAEREVTADAPRKKKACPLSLDTTAAKMCIDPETHGYLGHVRRLHAREDGSLYKHICFA